MCLLLIDWRTHVDFELVVAANRDEFHARPSAAADWWSDYPLVLGGRDLEAEGTWLAVNKHGHFAAVTNVRKPGGYGTKTRGALAVDFLVNTPPRVAKYLPHLRATANDYNGYNFIGFDGNEMAWFNNAEQRHNILGHGLYGLSNAALDTAWPKVLRLKSTYQQFALSKESFQENLFELLLDKQIAADEHLPDTGIALELERRLSPIFIEGTEYGTRCSTVYTLRKDGLATFTERRFDRDRNMIGESSYEFEIAISAK
ncbi:MAG: NRDE family protein [Gammaproteobacteria bacterium]